MDQQEERTTTDTLASGSIFLFLIFFLAVALTKQWKDEFLKKMQDDRNPNQSRANVDRRGRAEDDFYWR